jgi:hypothetical protein
MTRKQDGLDHHEDACKARLDRVLDTALRQLEPCLLHISPRELRDRLIQHLQTHFSTEMTYIATGSTEAAGSDACRSTPGVVRARRQHEELIRRGICLVRQPEPHP